MKGEDHMNNPRKEIIILQFFKKLASLNSMKIEEENANFNTFIMLQLQKTTSQSKLKSILFSNLQKKKVEELDTFHYFCYNFFISSTIAIEVCLKKLESSNMKILFLMALFIHSEDNKEKFRVLVQLGIAIREYGKGFFIVSQFKQFYRDLFLQASFDFLKDYFMEKLTDDSVNTEQLDQARDYICSLFEFLSLFSDSDTYEKFLRFLLLSDCRTKEKLSRKSLFLKDDSIYDKVESESVSRQQIISLHFSKQHDIFAKLELYHILLRKKNMVDSVLQITYEHYFSLLQDLIGCYKQNQRFTTIYCDDFYTSDIILLCSENNVLNLYEIFQNLEEYIAKTYNDELLVDILNNFFILITRTLRTNHFEKSVMGIYWILDALSRKYEKEDINKECIEELMKFLLILNQIYESKKKIQFEFKEISMMGVSFDKFNFITIQFLEKHEIQKQNETKLITHFKDGKIIGNSNTELFKELFKEHALNPIEELREIFPNLGNFE